MGGRGRVDGSRKTGPCWNNTAVPNPADNPGLMRDCIKRCWRPRTPSEARRRLNWSVDTPITSWDGVKVSGSPAPGHLAGSGIRRPHRHDTNGPGTARRPGVSVARIQPADRRDTGSVGRPREPEKSVIQPQPADGRRSAGAWGAVQIGVALAQREPAERRDPGVAGRPQQPAATAPCGQPAVRSHPVGSGRPVQPRASEAQLQPADRRDTFSVGET